MPQAESVIGGGFRLGFRGYTTATISHDATASEVAVALTDLPSIDSVDVSTVQPNVPELNRGTP